MLPSSAITARRRIASSLPTMSDICTPPTASSSAIEARSTTSTSFDAAVRTRVARAHNAGTGATQVAPRAAGTSPPTASPAPALRQRHHRRRHLAPQREQRRPSPHQRPWCSSSSRTASERILARVSGRNLPLGSPSALVQRGCAVMQPALTDAADPVGLPGVLLLDLCLQFVPAGARRGLCSCAHRRSLCPDSPCLVGGCCRPRRCRRAREWCASACRRWIYVL
jgi:hypothetical protein